MRTAVVVGTGMGGLAAAGALARTGWQVTLLERDDRVRAERTALWLWPNGVRALHALGLGGGLDAIATPVPPVGVRRPDGQWLASPGASGADVPVVVHREDLHDTLIAGLGDRVQIRTGVAVRGVRATPGERPAVTDGRTSVEADLVVAADGVDSVIRRRVAPESMAVSTGCSAWRAVIPWYRAPRLPDGAPVAGETLGAGYRFVAASLGERAGAGGSTRGGIYWVATAAGAPRPEPPATQLALLRRWFAGWHAPIGELLGATEPDDLVQREVRELRPLPRGYGFPGGPGGVVLLGDAAHAMPHHLGQGACLAFEDAATLSSVMADATPGPRLLAAVAAYDEMRRPRAARVVRQARRYGAVVQARGRLARRARDAAFGALSPRLFDRATSAAADWHPPSIPPTHTIPSGQPVPPGQAVPPGQPVLPGQPVPPGQAVPPGQPVLPGQAVPPGQAGAFGQAVPEPPGPAGFPGPVGSPDPAGWSGLAGSPGPTGAPGGIPQWRPDPPQG